MIANSGHDERGKYSGGQAGDQTGTEWEIKAWYNRPWSCVLRHPNRTVGDLTATMAIAAANNPNCGYDQGNRLSFYYALRNAAWEPANINTPCEGDCSSEVTALTIGAGHRLGITALTNLSPSIYTGNMRAAFKKAGFEVLTESKYLTSDKYLMPGDILLYDGHHTAINLDYGSAVTPKEPDYYYKNLGWNKDANGWWYAYGHNKGEYHVNNIVRIDDKLWAFDVSGYLVNPNKCEMDADGSIKYIHGDRTAL